MVKTRSQKVKVEPNQDTSSIIADDTKIKKEECKPDVSLFELLEHDEPRKKGPLQKVSKANKKKTVIKRESSPNNIKIEDKKKIKKRFYTPQEIKKLIGYIVDDKMVVKHAADKINMSYAVAKRYYRQYKLDPEKNIPGQNSESRKFMNEHTEFIKQLYKTHRSISVLEIYHTLLKRFPDLDVRFGGVHSHIRSKLMDLYEASTRNSKEARNLKNDKHKEYIGHILKKEPTIPLSIVFSRVNKKFPQLNISSWGAKNIVHKHFPELYMGSEGSRKYRRHKLYDVHMDFIQNVCKHNPSMTLPLVYKEFIKKFPSLSITLRGFVSYLQTNHSDFYNKHKRQKRKVEAQHVEFLADLVRNNPNITVPSAQCQIKKAFPGFSVANITLHQYLKEQQKEAPFLPVQM
ncbi:hypothetical protein K501DRAFT_328353 [Backusella circina FSU 941]|nr:hypothetical protein K501DRAFT_328353 [Backusella circina FSU 941]